MHPSFWYNPYSTGKLFSFPSPSVGKFASLGGDFALNFISPSKFYFLGSLKNSSGSRPAQALWGRAFRRPRSDPAVGIRDPDPGVTWATQTSSTVPRLPPGSVPWVHLALVQVPMVKLLLFSSQNSNPIQQFFSALHTKPWYNRRTAEVRGFSCCLFPQGTSFIWTPFMTVFPPLF